MTFGVGVTFTCGHKTFFDVSFSNLFCMLLVTSSWTNSMMAKTNSKWPIFCDFPHFM